MGFKNKIDILGLQVSTGKYQTFIEKIIDLAFSGTSSYVCVANVHMLVEAYRDKRFSEIVNGADIITPDGVPLVWASRLLYGKKQDRVAGMDLLPDLLKRVEQDNLPVYFYGGTTEMLKKTKGFLELNYTYLNITGLYSPPFRALTVAEQKEIEQQINDSKAKIVFVVLGCPKQEKWMASMKGKVNACMIGIGGALPVLIGAQKRAPQWMQKNGLEWLYRLAQEPGRLAKRYIVTNSIFIWLLLKAWLKQLFTLKAMRGTM
ncbi:MAG: WecB/TagA/CpsF family glycosyltransferase [Chitinophagaceae bacterium]|nr:WecB/TagA/CpsF family glycosyltransferase [Chitinophagaceae bacterium]